MPRTERAAAGFTCSFFDFMSARLLRTLGVVAVLVFTCTVGRVSAQTCQGQWLPGGDVLGSPNDIVNVVMNWDPDGAGPMGTVVVIAGAFTVAGDIPANHIATWDGTNFSVLGTGLDGAVYALAVLPDGELVAAGGFAHAGGTAANNIARWNGSSWLPLGSGTDGLIKCVTVLAGGDIVAGGRFATAGGVSANHVARWNGTGWSALGGGTATEPGISGEVDAVTSLPSGDIVAGGMFVHAGGVTVNNIARWNGVAWSPLGTGMANNVNGTVSALTVMPNGDLIAGGYFFNAGGVVCYHIARWNGTAWSALGLGLDNHFGSLQWGVTALLVLPTGDLVATGRFDIAGGQQNVYSIARWDGANWWPFGTGGPPPANPILSISLQPDGDIVAGGGLTGFGSLARWHVSAWIQSRSVTAFDQPVGSLLALPDGGCVAGGVFTRAGGNPARFLARWDGRTWSEFGGGLTPAGSDMVANPLALALTHNGDVIAGGIFSAAGNTPAAEIARWNGTAWSAFGAGFNNSVRTVIELPNGDVVAGGYFTASGGTPLLRIAHWNGSAWSAMGAGFNDAVSALAVLPNGDMVAGGNFTNDGTTTFNRIARWNGSSWSPMGTGMNGSVAALAVLPNGDLIAGGFFGLAGGAAVNNIARWNGSAWTPLGQGVSSIVNSLAVLPDGELVAGGTFLQAGGVAALRIARWDGSTWSRLGPGLDDEVSAVAALTTGDLCAGGTFRSAGGVPTASFARFALPSADFNRDGDVGTDQDIEAFFACLGGNCCPLCTSADFNGDGDVGTDADIESFFRVLGGGSC